MGQALKLIWPSILQVPRQTECNETAKLVRGLTKISRGQDYLTEFSQVLDLATARSRRLSIGSPLKLDKEVPFFR